MFSFPRNLGMNSHKPGGWIPMSISLILVSTKNIPFRLQFLLSVVTLQEVPFFTTNNSVACWLQTDWSSSALQQYLQIDRGSNWKAKMGSVGHLKPRNTTQSCLTSQGWKTQKSRGANYGVFFHRIGGEDIVVGSCCLCVWFPKKARKTWSHHNLAHLRWSPYSLSWLVLSDEQMRKRWQFSLLNNEQMSNWLGVKHLPVELIVGF